jgi:hypothetical protein
MRDPALAVWCGSFQFRRHNVGTLRYTYVFHSQSREIYRRGGGGGFVSTCSSLGVLWTDGYPLVAASMQLETGHSPISLSTPFLPLLFISLLITMPANRCLWHRWEGRYNKCKNTVRTLEMARLGYLGIKYLWFHCEGKGRRGRFVD